MLVRWMWTADHGQLRHYERDVSSQIEAAFVEYVRRGEAAAEQDGLNQVTVHCTTSPSSSPDSAAPHEQHSTSYTIHLYHMSQVPTDTSPSFRRRRRYVRRTVVVWQFQDDDGVWKAIFPQAVRDLEDAFQQCSHDASASTYDFTVGRFSYTADFDTMTQVNNSTNKKRAIRRLQCLALPLLTPDQVSDLGRPFLWQFKLGDVWENYDASQQQQLMERYLACMRAPHEASPPTRVKTNKGNTFKINLMAFEQYNIKTRERHQLRLIVTNAWICDILGVKDDDEHDNESDEDDDASKDTPHEHEHVRTVKPSQAPPPRPFPGAAPQETILPDNPVLTVLKQRRPPALQSGNLTRRDVLLFLAHTILWYGPDLRIYGGFVRDYVVNGEEPNDIDVLLPTSQHDPNLVSSLTEHLTSACKPYGIRRMSAQQKGAAFALRFQGSWRVSDSSSPHSATIDVDFTPKRIIQHPGVDCSAGNLCLKQRGVLDVKVPLAATVVGLAESVRHCQNKQFVFFYAHQHRQPTPALDMCVRRLTKYFQRGWTCLSPLPDDVLRALQNARFQHRLQPDRNYSTLYSFMA